MQDEWKAIPGYNGKYEINTAAEIRSHYRDGRTRRMKHSLDRTNRGTVRVVDLIAPNGRRKRWSVMMLMLMANGISVPPGMYPYHKNGLQDNNQLENIGLGTLSELGRRAGKCRRPVAKIGPDGAVLTMYGSVAEAGRKNGYSPTTIGAYYQGRIQPAPGGCTFRYCDEIDKEETT